MGLIANSHVPKQAQIFDILRKRISLGVWTQGVWLPAKAEHRRHSDACGVRERLAHHSTVDITQQQRR